MQKRLEVYVRNENVMKMKMNIKRNWQSWLWLMWYGGRKEILCKPLMRMETKKLNVITLVKKVANKKNLQSKKLITIQVNCKFSASLISWSHFVAVLFLTLSIFYYCFKCFFYSADKQKGLFVNHILGLNWIRLMKGLDGSIAIV